MAAVSTAAVSAAPPAAPPPVATQPPDTSAAQPADSASQQPAAAPSPPPPVVPAPPAATAKDPVTANRAAPSDKSPRYKPPVTRDFNDPPASMATQPAVAAPPFSSTASAAPAAPPPANTPSAPPPAPPSGRQAVGPAQAEATPQPVAGAPGASASVTPRHQNGSAQDGATQEPATAPSAAASQAVPDPRTAAAQQTFPALAEPAAASALPQSAASLAASGERKDALRAVAASGPLQATPVDQSAQQAITLPMAPNQPAPAAAAPAAPAPAPPPPAPPAAQLAPALLALGQGAEGGQQMTLRLHPADLGMVQVQIDRSASGVATVQITVEKADTMQALLRDQAQLHHTLDQAGVPSVGRTVTFTMAPDASLAASGGGSSSLGQGSQHGSGNAAAFADNGTLGGGQNGGQGGGQGRGGAPNQEQGAYAGGRRNDADAPPSGSARQAPAEKWLRVGLNITA